MSGSGQLRETGQAFDVLRQFARKLQRKVERCEMCSAELRSEHAHLIEPRERRLHCVCDPCAMLFSCGSGMKYKRVPRDVRLLVDFQMSAAEWDSLLIPINLAFFLKSSIPSKVSALYPSPAGATESLLPMESWSQIQTTNPVLQEMEPDVEALLVNRVGSARGGLPAEHYIVPVDACYRLVGLIRLHWHGLSGGTEVWEKIGTFFSELRAKAQVIGRVHA